MANQYNNKKRKQQLQLVVKEQNVAEERIEFLKRKLAKVHDRYLIDIFQILHEIYKLRKEQIPSYTLPDLAREKGIEYDISRLRYVFGFMYMSEKSKELVREGKIKPSTILTMINSGIEFRDAKNQDALTQKYLNKEITMEDVSKLPAYHIMQLIGDENHMDNDRKILMNATYNMKGIAQRMDANVKHFQSAKSKELIKHNFNILKRTVDRITKDVPDEVDEEGEQYFCPYCKHIVAIQNGSLVKVKKNWRAYGKQEKE